MDDKNKNENIEVDLRDYFKIILAKKWLVLGVSLFAVIIAAVYNFQVPKIYEGSVWLELGKIKEDVPIESPAQISQKIKIGIYGDSSDVVVLNPDQTDLIQMKIKSAKSDDIKINLEKISALILTEHEEKIGNNKEALENEIKKLQAKINFLEQERKILEAKIKISAFEFDLFIAEERLLGTIEGSYSKLESLKNLLDNIKPTQIIKPVAVVNQPAGLKPLLGIIMAGLLGLFLGVFVVFSEKWLREYKTQSSDKS